MARVVAFVAHPDDEVLGVGGTLMRHVAKGDDVHVYIACLAKVRNADLRTEDALRVAEAAGWRLWGGDEEQLGYRVPSFDAVEPAEIVYTHHPGDLNRDHRLVSEGARVFARTAKSLRYFETPSSTEWGEPFVPNYFVSIDLGRKLLVLSHYGSELRDFPHPRSEDAVAALANWRGSTVHRDAAEAFVLAREVW